MVAKQDLADPPHAMQQQPPASPRREELSAASTLLQIFCARFEESKDVWEDALANLPSRVELQSIENRLQSLDGPCQKDVSVAEENCFSNEFGDLMLSQVDSIFEESEFSGKFNRSMRWGFQGECPYEHIWNKSKTKGIILERNSSGKANKGLLTSQFCTARKILEGWRRGDASALGWNEPFGQSSRPELQRWQFDMRGKNKEEFRKILRLIIE